MNALTKTNFYRFAAILLLLILTSCNNNSIQIKQLQQENEILKNEINFLQEQLSSYSFKAVAIPNKSEITLGEEYIAGVGLLAINEKNPPLVILCDFDEDRQPIREKDTLFYDKDYGMAVYKFKPNKVGKYTWGTKIRQPQLDGRPNRIYYTLYEYTVKPK